MGATPAKVHSMIWGMVQSPCKDCQDRAVGCHAKCERYADFKTNNEEKRKEVYIKKIALSAGPRWQEDKTFKYAQNERETRVFKDHKK